jgi:hypothetical protein
VPPAVLRLTSRWGVGGRGPAVAQGLQPGAQLRGGGLVERPGPAADVERDGGGADVVERQGADVGGAQRVDPGQQHDQLVGGVVQVAEQPGALAVVEGQHRRGLDPVSGERGGGVGEHQPAGLERGEQRPHGRQGQQPGRSGQRGELGGQVLGGDLPQRVVASGPAGQRGLDGAQVGSPRSFWRPPNLEG